MTRQNDNPPGPVQASALRSEPGETQWFRVGDIECLAVNDGDVTYSASRFFAYAPQDAVAAALGERGVDPERIPSPYTCMALRAGTRCLLIDTGTGGQVKAGTGNLIGRLTAGGVTPDDVDTVVLSHAHGDHSGGTLDAEGRPRFPRARYVIAEAEWEYWTKDADPSEFHTQFVHKQLLPLADRLERVSLDAEIAPGVRLVPAPGHTPGQVAVHVASRGAQLIYLADTVLHELHLLHPDWLPNYDHDRHEGAATRRRLLDQAAAEHALVHFFHFPFPGLGYVTPMPAAGGWHWDPVSAP